MNPASALVVVACLAVNPRSDQITAGELAASVPAFQSVAPDTPVALAPAPGVRRTLHAAEIQRIASRLGLSATSSAEVCFERRVAPVSPSAIMAAMQREAPDARLTLV